MDAADIDETTYGLFKQKIMGDINTSNTTAQEELAALILETQTRTTTYVGMAAALNIQTYNELVAYSEAHPEYTPVADPEEDAFNLAKAKMYGELNDSATATLAAQEELDRVGAAQYNTYSMMLAQLGSMTLEELIDYSELQPGWDPMNPPTEDTFDATIELILSTVQARQTNDLAANQTQVNVLLAQAATLTALATDLDVMTYTDFTDWVATLP